MTPQPSQPRNNRAVTLDGANRIFTVVDIEITQNTDLGFYEAVYDQQRYQTKTLTALCQRLLLALQSYPS